jgi:hypothetical protein
MAVQKSLTDGLSICVWSAGSERVGVTFRISVKVSRRYV